MPRRYLFSSESVGEGHPDKVCDAISDAVLDACLSQDPRSRVACETLVKGNLVVLAGEITTDAKFDFTQVARDTIRDIGYIHDDCQFHADRVQILVAISKQSRDIAQGVDDRAADGKETAEQGAGDQGLMFGFAVNETPELMPAPVQLSHQLGLRMTKLRKSGEISWLRPDAKTQVTVEYEDHKPLRVDSVVVSTQHAESVKHEEIRQTIIEKVIQKTIRPEWLDSRTRFLINPTGRFVIGGPEGDAGVTGRKIIVDTYGGMGRHGGGAFSGKDPSKVDRSAAYMGRYVAKNVVAAGLADRCEVQFAYAIGYPEPLSVHVDTFNTAKVDEAKIEAAICSVFSFKPAEIVRQLNLLRPIYRATTNYGHFGREDDTNALTWERKDKVDALRKAVA